MNSFLTRTKPWKHQIEAYRRAYNKPAYGLFMDMGTGKTKVAIDIIVNRNHNLTLVVCPTSVLRDQVWIKELKLHGAFDPLILSLSEGDNETKTYRLKHITKTKDNNIPLIVIINYESAWRGGLGKAILSTDWDCIILDEVHKIKSAGSKVSRFFARKRLSEEPNQILALTGTPMPNSPLDLYGIYRFLDRFIFGISFNRFRDRYAITGGVGNHQIFGYKIRKN